MPFVLTLHYAWQLRAAVFSVTDRSTFLGFREDPSARTGPWSTEGKHCSPNCCLGEGLTRSPALSAWEPTGAPSSTFRPGKWDEEQPMAINRPSEAGPPLCCSDRVCCHPGLTVSFGCS